MLRILFLGFCLVCVRERCGSNQKKCVKSLAARRTLILVRSSWLANGVPALTLRLSADAETVGGRSENPEEVAMLKAMLEHACYTRVPRSSPFIL